VKAEYNKLMATGRALRAKGRLEEAEAAFEAALTLAYKAPAKFQWGNGEPVGWIDGQGQGLDAPEQRAQQLQARLMVRVPLALTSAVFAAFGLVRLQFPQWAHPSLPGVEPIAMLTVWTSAIAFALFSLMPTRI
jgi:hypothetical protein